MKFRTKIDFWVYLLIAAMIVGIVFCTIDLFKTDIAHIFNVIFPITILGILLIVILPMLFSYYIIEEDYLYVKNWFFYNVKIPYKDITTVRPHVSIWSAPVLSVFRIQISYGKGGDVLITPRKQEVFLKLLNEKIEKNKIELI